MTVVKFYFDVISPYAWLGWHQLQIIVARNPGVKIESVPILFAALLNHYGHLGPAEIPPKRKYVMEDVARRASRRSLRLSVPYTHPFNPLLCLRIASSNLVSASDRNTITGTLLNGVWSDGKDMTNPDVVRKTLDNAGFNGEDLVYSALNDKNIKDQVRFQTDKAITEGVFGVPTFIVKENLFWGSDTEIMEVCE